MDDRRRSRVIGASLVMIGAAGALALLLFTAVPDRRLGGTLGDVDVATWFVTVAAAGCLVLSVVVVVAGGRRAQREVQLLGVALSALSLLATVSGLLMPGALVGPNAAHRAAGAWALPAAMAVAAPLIATGRLRVWLQRRWHWWLAGSSAAVMALSAGLIARRHWSWWPEERSWLHVAVGLVALVAATWHVHRHVVLYRIGRRAASLVFAGSLLYLALATVAAGSITRMSAAWWAIQVVDLVAVVGALGALLVAYRRADDVAMVFAPVVNHDPLTAIDLGLAPEIRAFVARLDDKDAPTRDHLVRVADLSIRVAQAAGLGPDDVRSTGLGAVLHDIGKYVIPTDVLTKPGALTDDEYALLKTHPERGEALLRESPTPVLAAVAAVVRHHHERHDGSGYPDRIRGEAISFPAAIVSVCDAWDAMTSDRHYRAGLDVEEAQRRIRDGRGVQWHPAAVDALLTVVANEGGDPASTVPALATFAR